MTVHDPWMYRQGYPGVPANRVTRVPYRGPGVPYRGPEVPYRGPEVPSGQ